MPISSVSTPSLVGGKGINDPALVKTLCEGTADAIDWLDANGMSLHNVSSFGGASVKRIHRPTNAEGKVVSVGAYLIPLMEENCAKRGIDIVLNTTVDTILTDAKGAAVGISGTDKDGNTVVVNAKSVVLSTGPFYAIKVTAGVHHTMGGVTINSATEVLKADGTAIPGLFAAGEVTGGVHGANRLGGTAVADFVVFGRIAGDSAAAYASAQ